jgi:adenylate cyclase
MAGNIGTHRITIDLNQFKLHIDLKNKIKLTLHFNSPSRRFYLSLIAFIVNEMKRLGKITSIPLEGRHDLLALLNETIGGAAGSSEKENLLPRIYRKWKDTLPNLEEAPLFKVLGRKKEYDDGIGKTYHFTEEEKDSWANLFEYKGSQENVRLRFAIDKIGAGLDDVDIIYEDSLNGDAWERFLLSLKGRVEKVPEIEPTRPLSTTPEIDISHPEKKGIAWQLRHHWILVATIVVIVGAATLAIWKLYLKPSPVKRASMERMAFPLPDKPSIAVLPFVNMSKESEQEFFSDGITENIITGLSKIPRLFVIARNSTFFFKGKRVKVQQVAEELGVRYVLEGSVQRSGSRVRITAQLIDTLTGSHLWAERYDRDLKDIFGVQDEITMKILQSMRVKLTEGEQDLRGKPPRNLEAFLKILQTQEYIQRFNIEGNIMGKRLAEEAVALDPDFARAYYCLASAHMMDVYFGLSKSPKESLEKAVELTQKAISLDPKDSRYYAQLGHLYTMKRDYDKAIVEGEKAVALDPGGADAHAWLGMTLNNADRPKEAIPLFEKAIRLNPNGPTWYFLNFGNSYRLTGQHQEAITQYKKALRVAPNNIMAHLGLAATYSLSRRDEEARAEAEEVLRLNPKFSLEFYAKTIPHKNQAQIDRNIDALRKAGLK